LVSSPPAVAAAWKLLTYPVSTIPRRLSITLKSPNPFFPVVSYGTIL
jgi:hypothetical protein